MIDPDHKRHGRVYIGSGAKICIHVGMYILFIFLSTFCRPLSCAAGDPVEVKGLRYHITPEYLRLVIDLSCPAEISKARLSNPERLFLNIKNAKLAKGLQKNYTINDTLVKGIRLGQFNDSTARIVFDVVSADYDFKIFSLEDPSRLIIDIFPKVPNEKKPVPGNIEKPAEPPKTETNREAGVIQRKIVLDPGHGGHDSGAVGPTGLCEKDVVLDIALRIRDLIKKDYPAYEVILTRDSDVFIPLPERAKVANKSRADFFLSIHANASPNRKARGIETYLLNWTNDEEALKVAARENAISLKKMKQVQGELGVILASLDRDRKRDGSLNLAGNIQRSLASSIKSRYPKVADLGVKQALFYVLVDA
ncbi:MAG TPA: N-acetylmuramoyl-L-alanine amidase, partial [Dissulfurispiraceae bacterium]|nr:N-acetylmuramoyl-L-alanine amidase [Dissulfurispiraceae bacterium]